MRLLISITAILIVSPLSAQSIRSARTMWASDSAEVPAIASEVDLMLASGRLQLPQGT